MLNGEPFTRYCLRSLYPFAYEIIVVEGACKHASDVADKNGHSLDGTLEVLHRFKAEEDPERKIQIITKDEFWREKTEQSQAYAERATGNILWQVDIDEFYHSEAMTQVIEILSKRQDITAISFRVKTFWGGLDYIVNAGDLWKEGIFRRLFRWGSGYKYTNHRPPTVCDSGGNSLFNLNPMHGDDLARQRVYLFHYSYIFPWQVTNKTKYYSRMGFSSEANYREWFKNTWNEVRTPTRILAYHAGKSWLSRYRGAHPPEIENMRRDIESGAIKVEFRRRDDIENLLANPWYSVLKTYAYIYECIRVHVVKRLRNYWSKFKRIVKAVLVFDVTRRR